MGRRLRRRGASALALGAALVSLGFSGPTVRFIAYSAVDFFPPDLARQVRRHHRRFEAGVERGLAAPPAWRAGEPGRLAEALTAQVELCSEMLRRPEPLDDLVEELGVLAVRVADANDPLAVAHDDPREPRYAGDYERYVESMLARVHLVYYGQDRLLIATGTWQRGLDQTLARSRRLYPFVGDEFYRGGSFRDWRGFDDRSVAFAVGAVSLSRALTDLANLAAAIWRGGGGLVPTPLPTPLGHVGPTVERAPLGGGFPGRRRPAHGRPALSGAAIVLPPP